MAHTCKSTFGRLIDFDHAKIAARASPPPIIPECIKGADLVANDPHHPVVSDMAVVQAYRHTAQNFRIYLGDMVNEIFPQHVGAKLEIDKKLTPTDLGWDDKDLQWPDFDDREPQKGERTGTLPYMSAEVLSQGTRSIYCLQGRLPRKPFCHNAVHDVESFLWVLIFLCLTRKGPGMDMVRDEFLPGSISGRVFLCVKQYFDDKEQALEVSKADLFNYPNEFEDRILALFHPYFDSLKPLVHHWWRILVIAYRYHADEYYRIHDHIIRLLQDVIKTIQDPSPVDEATAKELQRRKKFYEHTLCTFHRGQHDQSEGVAESSGNRNKRMSPPGSAWEENIPGPFPASPELDLKRFDQSPASPPGSTSERPSKKQRVARNQPTERRVTRNHPAEGSGKPKGKRKAT
ncbi:hypothetical protein H0H81_012394 [Sphagnurus paluster]|uniref:Fungal-type protein kinase domain-containing protein n=1 Tax=Sphagnurus paluster TaxID=117069 RepID=A0A9P7GHY9_9AGAR|nr:hypothetical protein H0H81_012394 [Sphagnurus paluster]